MVFSCTDNVEGVHIRIKNVSAFDYEEIFVNTTGGEHNYGEMTMDNLTDYYEFDQAYSYAYVRLLIGGTTYEMQPIDYVGETLLEDGFYTYELDVTSLENRNFSINLIED